MIHASSNRKSCLLAASLAAVAGTALAQQTARTTWQQEEQITDAVQECSYYDFPALDPIRHEYPQIWEIADLSGSGVTSDVQALFRKINASTPNIAPRGTPNGDWTGVSYNGGEDPACWWTYTGCTTPKVADVPADVTECLEPMTYGLSIDDGPNCSHTGYYDFLKETEQKATLFYIGSNVMNWPLQAQEGLGDGHDICVHTWSHNYMTSLSNEQAFAELYFTKQVIKDVMGITVRCWRPPYGDVDDRIRYIAEQLDLRTIIWTKGADTDDWNWVNVGIPKVQQNYEDIIAGDYSTHGVIVLSHELNNETMALSEQFLPQIQKKFTGGVMPINVCGNNTQPYIETSNTYPNYAQWASGTRSISLSAPTAGTRQGPLQLAVNATSVTNPSIAPSSTSRASSVQSTVSAVATMSSSATVLKASAASASTAKPTTSDKHSAAAPLMSAPLVITGMFGVVAAWVCQ